MASKRAAMSRIDHRKRDRRRAVFAFLSAAMGIVHLWFNLLLLVVALSASSRMVGDAFQLDLRSHTITFTDSSNHYCSMNNKLFAINPNKADTTTTTTTASGTPGTIRTKKKARLNGTSRIRITQQRRHGWDYRIQQLRSFVNAKGHCWVTARHEEEYPGLYQWTRTVRKEYRHQVRVLDDDGIIQQSFLSPRRIKQLTQLGFVWEPQEAAWNRRLSELQRFYAAHGHCRVPNNSLDYPGLGVWVRNQRREYGKLTKQAMTTDDNDDNDDNKNNNINNDDAGTRGSRSGSGTLTQSRLRSLEELDFEWYRSHMDAWQTRYEQLVEFYRQHGHSNAPQPQTQFCDALVEPEDEAVDDQRKKDCAVAAEQQQQLGNWCMNQRTAYRNYLAGQPTALTLERIEKLEAINFQWNVHRYKWTSMLQRLQNYHKVHGHINIAVDDKINQDLRLWLIWQRYLYNCRQEEAETTTVGKNSTWRRPSPLTDDRINALKKAIPKFKWKVRAGNSGGPSSKDWAELFDALRDKGFQPGMRPKQHWFEGINPFTMAVKSTYTEQDLLELWHQDADDEEEEEDFDAGAGMSTEADPWYDD